MMLLGLLTVALAGSAQAALWPVTPDPQPAPGARTQARPVTLDTLVLLLSVEDRVMNWDLAAIALDTLIGIYQESLDAATDERRDPIAARRKLWRWQQATAGLIAQLTVMRDALEAGAPFELMVDHQGQVLLQVDAQLIIVAAYSPDSNRRLQQQVLREFCYYNDCAWLGLRPDGAADSGPADSGPANP